MKNKKNTVATSRIFDRVITVGPDLNSRGGISSVIRSYRDSFPVFHFLPTNNKHGFIRRALTMSGTMLRLPFARIFKGRKILHVHVASGNSFVRKSILVAWAKACGYKVILHCHSGLIRDYAEKRGVAALQPTFDRASVVVALTQSWRDYYVRTFHCPRVAVVDNIVAPVDAVTFPPVAADGVLHLLFFGKICDAKGIFDLIEVIGANALRWRGRVSLTVGGNDEVGRLLADVERLGITDMVKYVGWVDGRRKEELLRSADLLLLPSYAEGFPISLLEAMAHGTPVIASDVGGIPEMITDGKEGTIHSAGDRKALGEAIDFYLDNPAELTRRGRLALATASRYYPERVVAELAMLYAEVLGVRTPCR